MDKTIIPNGVERDVKCTVCGKTFIARGSAAKYCSQECRLAACREMDRKKYRREHPDGIRVFSRDGTKRCKGCRHYDTHLAVCDYIGHNGRCRPCAINEGGGCAVYSRRKEPRTFAKGLDKWDWSDEEARALLDSGMTYFEVAEKLGASFVSIEVMLRHGDHGGHHQNVSYPDAQKQFERREKARIEQQKARKRFDEMEYRKLYAEGLNDEVERWQ